MLVGRERETTEIVDGLDRAAAGAGQLFAFVGEPGIGKTRFADEVAGLAEARGFAVHWGRTWETGGAPAYWPWVELVESIRAAQPALESSPAIDRLLTRAPSTVGDTRSGDPARERFALFEGVSAFLRAAARATPLVLVLDDVHAADLPTLEMLHFVARGMRRCRFLIAITMRDAEARVGPAAPVLALIQREARVMWLGRLAADHVARLVEDTLHAPDERIAAELHRITEGNPLFVHEVLGWIAARPRDGSLPALDPLQLAGGVVAVIRQRIALVAEPARELLPAAAVYGRKLEVDALVAVTRLAADDVRARIAQLEAAGIVTRAGGESQFSHVLVREALYRELEPPARRALHHAFAAMLRDRAARGREDVVAQAAHHALAALPDGDPHEAVRIAMAAAERARSKLAYEESVALLQRARDATEALALDEPLRVELLIATGWATSEAGNTAAGREAFRAAAGKARAIGDAKLFARSALGIGAEYVLGEVRDELSDVLREALAMLGDTAPDLRARCLGRLAAALIPCYAPEEPLGFAREALRIVRGLPEDPRLALDVSVAVGSAFADFAEPTERVPVNEELVRRARQLDDRVLELRGVWRLITDRLESGDVAGADTLLPAQAKLAREIGLARYTWRTPLFRSMRAMIEGRFDECEAAIDEARALASDIADENAARCIAMHRWLMLVHAGRPAALRAHEPVALAASRNMAQLATFTPLISASSRAHDGDVVGARALIADIQESQLGVALAYGATLADTVALTNLTALYSPLYQRLLPAAARNAVAGLFALVCGPPVTVTLGRLAGLLGQLDAARTHFEAALVRVAAMRAPAHEAWTTLWYGDLLVEAGVDGTRARELLDTAVARARELAMPEIEQRAEERLAQLATAAPRPRAPTALEPPAASTTELTFQLACHGDTWMVHTDGRTFPIKNLRGMALLARLCEAPEREIHALELIGESPERVPAGDAGEMLDAKARLAYRARVEELREELEEAESFADLGRAERARVELEALTAELARAVGLGGRVRRDGNAAERARITVQKRIREAIKRIGEEAPELGRHLEKSVRTGTFCAYEPSRADRKR